MTLSDRAEQKQVFLAEAGWGGAVLSPLAGDASNRRYERVAGGPGHNHAVLMDAPAERGEDINIFLAFTGWLRDQRLSAPEVLAADIAAGFALIEDLGDTLYARVCAAEPACEADLYGAAVDLLADIAAMPLPVSVSAELAGATPCAVAAYDELVLMREAMLALDWWVRGATGQNASDSLNREYRALIAAACAPVAEVREALVLRDYHAENLLWLPDRLGNGRVGLLDYQDALAGSAAYDLVSLLEDARRDTSAELREAMIVRFLERRGSDAQAFRRDFAILGAQRNLKIIGIFARLWLRDGKASYLDMIPRVWGHLMRDLEHPHLAALAAFVRQHIPAPDDEVLNAVRAARS